MKTAEQNIGRYFHGATQQKLKRNFYLQIDLDVKIETLSIEQWWLAAAHSVYSDSERRHKDINKLYGILRVDVELVNIVRGSGGHLFTIESFAAG